MLAGFLPVNGAPDSPAWPDWWCPPGRRPIFAAMPERGPPAPIVPPLYALAHAIHEGDRRVTVIGRTRE
jgi:hypothetical protein